MILNGSRQVTSVNEWFLTKMCSEKAFDLDLFSADLQFYILNIEN